MIVGLKCTNIDWEKQEITLSLGNLKEVRDHYIKYYNDNKKRRDKHDPEMMRWQGIIETLDHIITFATFPVLS